MTRLVALFLGDIGGPRRDRPLDEQAMPAVAHPSLDRQREGAASSRDELGDQAGLASSGEGD